MKPFFLALGMSIAYGQHVWTHPITDSAPVVVDSFTVVNDSGSWCGPYGGIQ